MIGDIWKWDKDSMIKITDNIYLQFFNYHFPNTMPTNHIGYVNNYTEKTWKKV